MVLAGFAWMGLVAMGSLFGGNGPGSSDDETRARKRMVAEQIQARGIDDTGVLEAMRKVPRHRFVPETIRSQAYDDRPLPIGLNQTISQPYIVALMTASIEPDPRMRVLEIGTGSGYQAAILGEVVAAVYTIEIVPELGAQARSLLSELGHDNVTVRIGDGFNGWPDAAPFDAIVVTAAPAEVPQPLLDQLAIGGRLVIPVGERRQELLLITRHADGYRRRSVAPVRFVPMTGEAESED